MKKIKTILFSVLTIFVFNACAQNKDCVFDNTSITDDFLKNNKEIKSYKWSNKDKEAFVLMKTGEYIYVKKWACTSYGMEVKKIIMYSSTLDSSLNFWKNSLLNFGKQFLHKSDFNIYQEKISKSNLANEKKNLEINSKYEIDIPHDNYPEFYVTIERNKDMVVLTYSYYMN